MENSYINMQILSIIEAKKIIKNNRIVFLTGVTGQDGSFMIDYLLKNTDYIIFGGARRLSVSNHENISHLENNSRFHLINFDLTDAHSISTIIEHLKPDYFINLAAQSFVKSSWDFPSQTWETNATSIIHILESIRLHCPQCKVYNAGSSEEFGNVEYTPQNESHPLRPRSPYGASKAAARQLIKVYRESYNLYAIQGWLFNHESERRGEEFVTRKITMGVARIFKESQNITSTTPPPPQITPIELGNVDAKRDWSHAKDCVDSIWRMLNQELYRTDLQKLSYDIDSSGNAIATTFSFDSFKLLTENITEYVVSSGEYHSIREFVEEAFKCINIFGNWIGSGVDEKYVVSSTDQILPIGTVLVKINPVFYRPAEVELLCGNPTKIKSELKWNPAISFTELVRTMVVNDINS